MYLPKGWKFYEWQLCEHELMEEERTYSGGMPTLTKTQIVAIKKDYLSNTMTLDQIASKHHTNRTTVFNYVHGHSTRFKKEGK